LLPSSLQLPPMPHNINEPPSANHNNIEAMSLEACLAMDPPWVGNNPL
jgi:hypothetical protein